MEKGISWNTYKDSAIARNFVTLIREFLWSSPSTLSGENPKENNCEIACDAVRTKKIKLYTQIECQLGYLMMLISNGICQYEGIFAALNKNICHFGSTNWGHHRASFPQKIQSTETYTNDVTLRSRFFRITSSATVPRFRFFPRIHG